MQLTKEIHQEISELLADETASTVILGRLQSKGIDNDTAQRFLRKVTEMRNAALASSRGVTRPPIPTPAPTNAPIGPLANLLGPGVRTTASVPWINLADHPLVLDLGDAQPEVRFTTEAGNICVLDHLLSDAECDELLASAPTVARSTAVDNQSGDSVVHPARTSSGSYFVRGQTPLVARIEERIAKLTHWPVNQGEGLQLLRYEIHEEYLPHFDFFDPKQKGSARLIENGGNRHGTLILYLSTPEKGGSTYFPDAGGIRVYPKKGSAVFFSYDRPDESTKTRHAGAPVIAGTKWIATKWLRDRAF